MWFYAKDDRQIGPVSEDIIVELIRKGEITRETKVWRDGFQDWKKLEDTELSKYLVEAPKAPSYISNKSMDNPKENIVVTNKSSGNLKTLLIVMASVLITIVALSIGYVFIIKNKSSKSSEVNNYNQPPVVANQPQPSQAPPQTPQTSNQYPPPPSNYATPQQQTPTQYPQSQYSQTNEVAAIDLVVENYYSNIPNNLEVSYEQLSPERRASMPFSSWASGYGSTLYDKLQNIKVLELTPDYAKVFVTFQSKDIANDGGTIVKNWEGTWTLVKENGKWYLDRSDIRLANGYYKRPLY